MKTASIQHFDTLVNNRIHATYKIELKSLTNIYSHIMNKLTNTSPFILLLVPLFMMMVLTLTTNIGDTRNDEVTLKSTNNTAVAKVAALQAK